MWLRCKCAYASPPVLATAWQAMPTGGSVSIGGSQ
jgi:hypothetical protein